MNDRRVTLGEGRCREVLSFLAEVRDIIDERVVGQAPPRWAVARGWDGFLLGLSDLELARCGSRALSTALSQVPGVPSSLAEVAVRTAEATFIPQVPPAVSERDGPLLHVSPRKGLQIQRLLETLGGLGSQAERIVDIGAGAGHLTRRATEEWRVPALGLECEERLVERARLRSGDSDARFVRFDAFLGPLDVRPTDLLIGLHACGALSDVLVAAAARVRCPIALVSCCYQKQPGPRREPLSNLGGRTGLSISTRVLGLANLRPRPEPLGARLADSIEERTGRHALRLLLEARGFRAEEDRTLRPPRGHRIFRGFPAMARAACRERGIAPPAEVELSGCLDNARADMAAILRLSLPRNMLARLLEIGIALDRAAFLIERGFSVRLFEPFPDDASPRNLLLVAEP